MYWVEQPASIGLYVLLMLWILYLWLRQNWYIRRTCRRLKSGVPLDHNPQERHTAHSVICGTILTLAVLCGVLMAVQAVERAWVMPWRIFGMAWGMATRKTICRSEAPRVLAASK